MENVSADTNNIPTYKLSGYTRIYDQGGFISIEIIKKGTAVLNKDVFKPLRIVIMNSKNHSTIACSIGIQIICYHWFTAFFPIKS